MIEFNISVYIKILQNGLVEHNRQETAGKFLLASINTQNTVDIDGKMISNLVHRKTEIHDAIKEASTKPEVIAEAVEYFNSEVLPMLNPHTGDDTYNNLVSAIKEDLTVAEGKRQSLIDLYTADKRGEFLAKALMYALNRVNRSTPVDKKNKTGDNLENKIIENISKNLNQNKNMPNINANDFFKKHSLAKEFVNREKPRKIFYDTVGNNSLIKKNIIMYYGIGGIGKSSLIKNLKIHLGNSNIKYSSVDFDDPALHSPSKALIELEKRFKYLFPHFDIAVTIYFIKKNPEFTYNDKGLPNAISKLILNMMQTSNDSYLNNNYGIVDNFYSNYSDKFHLNYDIKNDLEKLEELSPYDIENQLSNFFAFDLHCRMAKENIEKCVIFFDTYELLWANGRNESNKLSADTWIRTLVSLLQNVIFVISGRERLQWALECETWIDRINFVPLDVLSNEYANIFLETCKITDAKIQETIITASKGHPYYLDLCVDTYFKLISANKEPTIESFGKGFQEIQERFFRSLTNNEIETLRVLSIPRFYDLEIFKFLVDEFSTGYSIVSIDNFNAFSFIKSETNGKLIIHILMREEISKHISKETKRSINSCMISFYEQKLNTGKLGIDEVRYFFSELLYHLESAMDNDEIINNIEEKYIPIIKRLQLSGETKYVLECFGDLFNKNQSSLGGTDFFAIMVDMIHLSGRYADAVNLIKNYLSKFTIKEIANDGYCLNLFIREIHHQMFYVPVDQLRSELDEITKHIDTTNFPEQYCETLFMLGAHIFLPAGEYDKSKEHLCKMMKLANENKLYGLLCRGLRKYAELLCAQKKYQTAEKICLAGLKIAKKTNSLRYELYLRCVLGEIKRLTGETTVALDIFNEVKPISISLGIKGWMAHVNLSIGNCYVDLNNFDAAFESYNVAKELYESIDQKWGSLNTETVICRANLIKSNEVNKSVLQSLKFEAEKYGYKILSQKIESLISKNHDLIQFEYL